MQRCICSLLLFACLAGLVSVAAAQEPYWNQFRGPTGDGISHAKNLPVEFNETTNVRWKTAIHDQGWSSPVVWGNQVWLTTALEDGAELFAICVNIDTGEIIHDIKVFDEPDAQVQWGGHNTHATPTPIVENGRVYVHFGSYGTACLDTTTGETLWENREHTCDHRVRPASSPIIYGDTLFLTFDGVDVQFIVALDKNTGETQWVKPRAENRTLTDSLLAQGYSEAEAARTSAMKPDDNRKSYATPAVIEHDGKKQLISPAAEVTYAYDPETGEEIWKVKHEGLGFNVASRPIYEGGLLYLTQGVSSRLVAVDPSGEGDVTESHVVWSADNRVPEIPSPLVVDGLLFMVNDSGTMTCLDAATGEQVWRERLRGGGTYWGSPLYADGRIYIAKTKGNVYVVAADREFEILAMNEFNDDKAKGASDADSKTAEITAEDVKEMMKTMGIPEDQIDQSYEGALKKGMSNDEIAAALTGKGAKGPTGGRDSGVGFIASPAIAGDAILLRSETHLYCIAREK